MEFVQQNINIQKTKLLNLINNLNSTLLIEQGIFINNEIQKECNILSTFLNEKQNYILNPMGINNNNNINPFLMPPPNTMMNAPQMNINPIQMPQVQLFNNNQNNIENENQNRIIDLYFYQSNTTGKTIVVHCNNNDKIWDVIEKYRNKANDYSDNYFLYNSNDLNGLTSSIIENKIYDKSKIDVSRKGVLRGAKNSIHISN